MLARNAHPSRSISAPANGSTGQYPSHVATPAIPKVTPHSAAKNSNAPWTLNEQCGARSKLCAAVNTGGDYTSQFAG
jgi:hypothetical protein